MLTLPIAQYHVLEISTMNELVEVMTTLNGSSYPTSIFRCESFIGSPDRFCEVMQRSSGGNACAMRSYLPSSVLWFP